jgi:hypothetical protein
MYDFSPGGEARLSRRRLLQIGTTVGAAALLPPLARATAIVQQTQYLPISFGFVAGSGAWPHFRPLPWEPLPEPGGAWLAGVLGRVGDIEIAPADTTPADTSLAGQWAAVRVHGIYPGLAPPDYKNFRSLALIHWHSVGAGRETPVLAWGARRIPGPSTGSPVSYPYRLDDKGLRFTVEVFSPVPGRKSSAPVEVPSRVFNGSLTTELPGAGLRRGVYLLGLEPGLWSAGGLLLPPDDPLSLAQSSIVVSVDPLEDPA